jgi:RNA recognition motif-containing protein
MFLGNLAFTVPEQDVRELFAPYGEVERITLMTDRETGRPRGFGFVKMADDTAAQAAIAALHGHELVGRAFNVHTARPREERRPSGGGQRW